ncbi:MAG TPA: metallopeptidase TldD-related protein [Armatimonadota bacterium]|nr:metallopeptidase TldD-related protein [Armatimonadota bacterium]
MGLGQSNIMNGDFSVNVSLGYKIEEGEIVGRVKNTMLADDACDALMRVEAVGCESPSGSARCARRRCWWAP